ncbi:hypothetical protein F511_24381 [Dorcoceras hygrometricum]|uniref:Uncharacterized protein n=1 Tax=Dorcoceras hygrometricum TaxID=472368 RepID=A0A2Z7A8U8_9LAMI|nr:hypothetical protein F511_24381 [Dorcoceras hygrometricum]
MSIELQSDFSKGKSGNISSDELTDCTRSKKISSWSTRLVKQKSYSGSESNRVEVQRMKHRVAQVQIKCSAQGQCLSAEPGTSAVIECRSDHQWSTIFHAERPTEGPAGKSARNLELFEREERLARSAHLGRGRICMLVGHSSSLHIAKMVHLRKPAWGTAQMKNLLR